MQAPFLRPSMVDALMINSISGTSVSAILANIWKVLDTYEMFSEAQFVINNHCTFWHLHIYIV